MNYWNISLEDLRDLKDAAQAVRDAGPKQLRIDAATTELYVVCKSIVDKLEAQGGWGFRCQDAK